MKVTVIGRGAFISLRLLKLLAPNWIRDTYLHDKHNLVTIAVCIFIGTSYDGNSSKYLFFIEKHNSHIKLTAFDWNWIYTRIIGNCAVRTPLIVCRFFVERQVKLKGSIRVEIKWPKQHNTRNVCRILWNKRHRFCGACIINCRNTLDKFIVMTSKNHNI